MAMRRSELGSTVSAMAITKTLSDRANRKEATKSAKELAKRAVKEHGPEPKKS